MNLIFLNKLIVICVYIYIYINTKYTKYELLKILAIENSLTNKSGNIQYSHFRFAIVYLLNIIM